MTFIDVGEEIIKRQPSKTNATSSSSRMAAWFFIEASVTSSLWPSRDDIYVTYTVKNLCRGPSALMYKVFSNDRSRPCVHPHQPMMSQCLLTLATAFYGLQNRDSSILQDGMRRYGQALSTLRHVLVKDYRGITTHIITSVLALGMVEVCILHLYVAVRLCGCLILSTQSIMPHNESPWTTHILGLDRLLALHGPFTANNNDVDCTLVQTCRPLLIIGSFFTQKPSSMSKPEWKVSPPPQTLDGTSSLYQSLSVISDLDPVLSTLAELPALFQKCNELVRLVEAGSSPSYKKSSVIWTKVGAFQQELQTWKENWSENHRSEVYEVLPISPVKSEYTVLWTNGLYFSKAELAIAFTFYHSAIILVNSIPINLYNVGLFDLSYSICGTSASDLNSIRRSVRTSVHSICRSVEYYLQIVQPIEAPVDYYMFFPMHVAKRATVQESLSAEFRWLEDAFEAMKAKFHLGVWAHMTLDDRFSGFGEGLFG